ncbi:phage integrase family protein [bacterium]|nr:phage integrase family protein [bacterium]
MLHLAAIEDGLDTQQKEIIELTFKLDESIIERISKGNTAQGLSENTKRAYLSAIRDFNQFLHDNSLHLSQESLKLYFDEIKGKLRASTLNLKKTALLRCVKAQIGANNILKHIAIERAFQQVGTYAVEKSVARDECLTEDDIKALMGAAQSTKTRLIIHFLYKTACRVSEMIGIRLSDCKPINGYIKIRVVGKGRKERDVSIPQKLYEAIITEYQSQTWLFESKTGKQLNPNNVGNQVRKAARRVGISNYSPHMLRHSRATDMLLQKNVSLKAVSKYLGHSSVAVTAQMYVHDEVDVTALFAQDSI